MKTRPLSKAKDGSRAREATALLRRALQRPGVREVMEVYRHCQPFTRAAENFREATAPRQIISASSGSQHVL